MTGEAILVVDDDRDLLASLRSILDSEGYEVDVAESGSEAIGYLNRRLYRLLLLDVFLSDMSGLDLLSWARRNTPNSVIIMLSGNTEIDSAIRAMNNGADHFFLKPIQAETLLRVVRERLKERSGDFSIDKDDVTVVLPVLNEEKAIGIVLSEIREEGYENVIVVDGWSRDSTVKIAEGHGVQVIMQHGSGKTGALRTAFENVKTPYLLIMDGDHTYSAGDIERFMPFASRFDQIFGSRKSGRENICRLHRLGNWIINTAMGILFGASLSDVCTGMYMMKTEAARRLDMRSRGFDVEVEAAIQNITSGSVTEVPVSYRERLGKRKLSTWRQGFRILWTVFRLSFSYNPIFFLSILGSLHGVAGAFLLLREFYKRLIHGEAGWSTGYVWLGLVLFITGLNFFSVTVFTLLSKRQEQRIIRYIKEKVR